MRFRRSGAMGAAAWAAVATGIVLGACATLAAQQPPEPEEKPEAVREQTIYIPYTKLRETFEKHGRGVFLPYEEFQKLWNAARDKNAPPLPEKIPVQALITEVASEATVAEQVVNVSALVKIDLLAPGWHKVPLRLSDAAIRRAEIAGKPARIVASDEGGYALLVMKEGKAPEQIELSLEYARSFTKAPGQNSVSFSPPLAPVNRWKIRIPEAGVRVNVQPMLATTEAPADASAKETVVLAFVGAAPTVRVDWTPKSEGAAGLAALASVQAQQEINIEEGVVRTRTRLAYEISRAELSQLVIEVPADQKVVGVFDPNVRQWQVAVDGAIQRITAELFQPAKTQQNVTVELEKFLPESDKQDLVVPLVQAANVSRQQGFVVVRLATGLRAEVKHRHNLSQSDASDLPPQLQQTAWTFAYRYAAPPYELTLGVEKVQPEIQVDELVEAYLEPERVNLHLLAVYQIERAGVFELQLDVPQGYQVREVRGHGFGDVQAAVVDTHHLEGDPATRLHVNLGRKAFGKVGLFVHVEKSLNDANLLAPTGKSSEIALPPPRVDLKSVERTTGRMIVYGPESLRLNPSKQNGLRSISFQEAFTPVPSMRNGRYSQLRPVLAYAFSEEPVELVVAAERRKPFITARQLLVARVDAGVVKYQARVTYTILYSGVKSLRLDVPAELADLIHNESPLREKAIEPRPDDAAKDYVAWSLTGDAELLGDVVVTLSWERPLEIIDVGKSVEITLPSLHPKDVERAWGQIVVVKTETLDVQPAGEPQGLRPIDPQHDLMPGASVPDAAMAFQFEGDWRLTVKATRYQLEAVKHTSIERAVLRMVVTRSDQISVQALYRLRSAHQRLAIRLPDGVEFDTEPLRINGRPVVLERGDQQEFYAPLVGQTANEPLVLELRYTQTGDASRLDFPTFPDEPAVQKVYLCAYLPQELACLGSRGPWNDEQTWRRRGLLHWTPTPNRSDQELVQWVVSECAAGNPLDQFQTDGRLHVYSTLRPVAPPDGSLRLTTINDKALSAIVFLVVAALGLVLLRVRMSRRLLALAALAALLVALGVFLPTFTRQIFDIVLWSALFLVFVMWLVVYVLRERPKPPVVAAPVAPTAPEGGEAHA